MTNPFNRLGLGRKPELPPEEPETEFGADVRVIGDRDAGKTTYLAALAYYPNKLSHSPIASIAWQRDSAKLVQDAKRLLEDGLTFEPSRLRDINKLAEYDLRITFKDDFSKQVISPIISRPMTLMLTFRDYPGELFDLVHAYLQAQSSPQGQLALRDPLKSYVENCISSTGILFLADGRAMNRDGEYATQIDQLLKLMVLRTERAYPWKVALVLTKCEQYDLFVHRNRPEFLAKSRFPELCEKLQFWSSRRTIETSYFVVSAFGRLGNDVYAESNSRKIDPNSDKPGRFYLMEPDRWRPFGIVAPVYWLCTGKRSPLLEQD